MTNIICYVAPSVVASLEEQIAEAKKVVSREDRVRVDRPKSKKAPIPRKERDHVIDNILRPSDGDRLWVHSLDVLGDSRREILTIFRALHGLGIPLISATDKMDGDMKATAYAIALEAALTRAEGRIEKRERIRNPPRRVLKEQKTGGRPKAMRSADVAEALALRVERKTWPEIVAHFAEKGVKLSASTIRRECAARRVL